MTAVEQWRPVVDYEGSYEVSDQGRIRSLDRITDRGRKWRGRMMSAAPLPNDYLIVTLWRGGRQRTPLIHRLVLTAFVGPAPDGHEALHKDGDRANNALSNLAWGTHSENQYDQVAHGTHFQARKTHCPAGHPYDDENTYTTPGRVHRACRACRREYQRNYHQQRKAAAA